MADERTLEWARERWANTVRLAALKTGSDREGWLGDGRYWLAIVEQLAANDGLRATVSRLMRERDEARKDAAFEGLARLKKLVEKLEAVHADPRYLAVWQSYMIHGGRYTEPTYTAELEAAKAFLTALVSPEVKR